MADLSNDEPVLQSHPPPYQALAWILGNAAAGHCGYLGNPVRHFQHLASRMSGPRAEVRSWRAWVCFHLAEKILNGADYPRDGEQIAREGLWIPNYQRALNEVAKHGWPGEWRRAECQRHGGPGILPGAFHCDMVSLSRLRPPPTGEQDTTG